MDTVCAHASIPELEDLLKKLDERDSFGEDNGNFLPDEVRFSNLTRMSDINLRGRLAYYQYEYDAELNKKRREEFYREVIRTRIELRRRQLKARTIAKILAEEASPPSVAPASASQEGRASASQAADAPLTQKAA